MPRQPKETTMAKNRKLTATLPNGEVITRTTARTYTHVVVYTISEAKAMAAAWNPEIEAQERKNFAYYTACAAGEHEHTKAPEGAPQWQINNAATYRTQAQYILNGFPTAEAYVAGRRARSEGDARKQIDAGWHIAGWCGRGDLAVKLAHSRVHSCEDLCRIIEVN
jgi:hypothetical protein